MNFAFWLLAPKLHRTVSSSLMSPPRGGATSAPKSAHRAFLTGISTQHQRALCLKWNQLPMLKKNLGNSTRKHRVPASGRCSGEDTLLYLHDKDPPFTPVRTAPYCLPDTDVQSPFPYCFTASTHCPHIHHLRSSWGISAFGPFLWVVPPWWPSG